MDKQLVQPVNILIRVNFEKFKTFIFKSKLPILRENHKNDNQDELSDFSELYDDFNHFLESGHF